MGVIITGELHTHFGLIAQSITNWDVGKWTSFCMPPESRCLSEEHHKSVLWSMYTQHTGLDWRSFNGSGTHRLTPELSLRGLVRSRFRPLNHWLLLFSGSCIQGGREGGREEEREGEREEGERERKEGREKK